jgi:hypothetical protein
MNQCLACERFTLRDHPGTTNARSQELATEMAKRHQMGRCSVRPVYLFLCPVRRHACADFIPTPADTLAKRELWLSKKRDAAPTING